MAKQYRDAGSGSVYQLHDHPSCPPLEPVLDPGGKPVLTAKGKPKRVRPAHDCRGTWRGSIELGWLPGGKRDRKPLRGKTKNAVVAKIKEEQKKLAKGGTPKKGVPKAGPYLRRWISEIRPHQRTRSGPIRPRTLQSDRTDVEHYLIPFFDKYGLDDIEKKPSLILEWQKWLRKQPRRRGEGAIAEATVLRAHAVASKAFDDALVLDGYIDRNPFKLLRRPGASDAEAVFLDADQAAIALQRAATDPLGSRWAFALLTGKRQGECLGLRWSHVDLDNAVADVAWQLQRLPYRHACGDKADGAWPCGKRFGGNCPDRELDVPADYDHVILDGSLCLTRPKSHRHIIPLVPSVVAWLKRRKEAVEAGPHDLVWARADGRPIAPRDDYDAWFAFLASCGLPAMKPHSARHTCATTLLALGVAEPLIMQLVGHSTVVAARRYLHGDLAAARRAALKLEKALGIQSKPARRAIGSGKSKRKR